MWRNTRGEGWSEDELYFLVSTNLEDGRDLCCELTDIMDSEEYETYLESKKNNPQDMEEKQECQAATSQVAQNTQ